MGFPEYPSALKRQPNASISDLMGRSFLTEPWNRSSGRAWALTLVVAVIGVLVGVGVRGLVSNAPAGRPVDPLAAVRSREQGLRVLFIGNSFTYFNSMPTMVEQLAEENPRTPRKVLAVQYAPGGSHLANAAQDPALLRLITSVHWNIVVLQEQSQVPALPHWLEHQSLPAVATGKNASPLSPSATRGAWRSPSGRRWRCGTTTDTTQALRGRI